jgi:diguanylate cyclase (GGDEF)-like protein/PAS domain S-box-containing protein
VKKGHGMDRQIRKDVFLSSYVQRWLRQRQRDAPPHHELPEHAVHNSIPIVVYVYDLLNETIVSINDEVMRVLGYTRADMHELGAIGFRSLVHPDDWPKLHASLHAHQLMQDAETVEVIYRMLHANGEWRWVQGCLRALPAAHAGDAHQVIGTMHDLTSAKQSETSLRRDQALLQAIINNSPTVILVKNLHGQYILVSQRAADNLRISREQVLGQTDYDLFPEHVVALWHAVDRRVLETGETIVSEETVPLADGNAIYLMVKFPLYDEHGKIYALGVVGTDITERKQAELTLRRSRDELEHGVASRTTELARMNAALQARIDEHTHTEAALRQSEARFRMVFEASPDAILVVALDGRLLDSNPAGCLIFGQSRDELCGTNLLRDELSPPEDLPALRAYLDEHMRTSEPYSFESRVCNRKGRVVPIEVRSSQITYDDVPALLLHVRDITERKATEAQLEHFALHDPLTGLPNRMLFVRHLNDAALLGPCAVLFLDLDSFKLINDSMGHLAGDRFLMAVAQRLRAHVAAPAQVARFGGDEFLILLPQTGQAEAALEMAACLHQAFEKPLHVDEWQLVMTVCIGIAMLEQGQVFSDDILRNASMAMYRAKGRGRGQTAVYDVAMHVQAFERLQLETDFRTALLRNELRVGYQPIVDLSTGKIVGFEALVRWQHPHYGLLYPASFIPILEESGMISLLDTWVMQAACHQAARWGRAGYARVPHINVNISGRTFLRPALLDVVTETLDHSGLPSHCLKVEITETVAMDHAESTIATLQQLSACGVYVSLDDFGTGYSSLRYLKRFPVRSLKIDASFVAGMDKNSEDAAIVRAVISLAHTLKIEVVAEGIETYSQLAALQAMGCEYGQGFLFSRAVDDSVAEQHLIQESFPIGQYEVGQHE